MRSVVIFLDTLRRDALAAYGDEWIETPNIDRLARRCVVYDNHYVGSLPCMPARRDIMTGRQNFLHCCWGGIEPYDDTLGQALRRTGVFSHLATDHYHYFHAGGENYHEQYDTWDFQRGQENDVWVSAVDKPALPEFAAKTKQNQQNWLNRERQQHEEDYSGPRTVKGAIDWLDRNGQSDDWFLQLELFDPHEPFVAPDDYLRLYDDDWQGKPFDWPAYAPCEESPDLVEHVRKRYAALLTMTDRWIGRFLDKMESLGIFDDTLVILTTDHGTCLGDHGYWMKNYFPVFQELAHIPLLVHFPGGAGAGERCSALTQTHDLFKTLCQHHGAEVPPHARGISFQDSYSGAQRRQAALFGYFGMAVNVTDGRYVYMRNPVREDNQPLNVYTAAPVMRQLAGKHEVFEKVETGRWFNFTHDLPLMRFPSGRAGVRFLHSEAGGVGQHQLWDVVGDSDQQHPLSDPELEEAMVGHLKRLMAELDAPPEQYERIGLELN